MTNFQSFLNQIYDWAPLKLDADVRGQVLPTLAGGIKRTEGSHPSAEVGRIWPREFLRTWIGRTLDCCARRSASPVRFSLKGWLPSVRLIPFKKNLTDNALGFRRRPVIAAVRSFGVSTISLSRVVGSLPGLPLLRWLSG